jgi:ribosomal protein S18 acetylase RimI-like enzyme
MDSHTFAELVRPSAPAAVQTKASTGLAHFQKLHQAWRIYEASFPPDERRALPEHLKILLQPDYRFLCHRSPAGNITGLIATWKLGGGEFTFIEHLAVDERLRGKGVGSKIVADLIKDKTNVVLEVEPAHLSPEAARRIGFYQKLGFHINDYTYYQPPYAPGKNAVEMKIMSYPNPLEHGKLDQFKQLVYAQVYKVSPSCNFGAEPSELGLERLLVPTPSFPLST